MTPAEQFLRFARIEARGSSPLYEEWAQAVAADPATLELISTLPEQKQQPNLVLAAARFAGAPVAPAGPFLHWLRTHWNQVVPVVLARSTQTNEAGRCAVLLPALNAMPGPLALLEVGASAGLCLTPDRYSYRYSRDGAETVLDPPSCSSSGGCDRGGVSEGLRAGCELPHTHPSRRPS
jgi:hypothetical protein